MRQGGAVRVLMSRNMDDSGVEARLPAILLSLLAGLVYVVVSWNAQWFFGIFGVPFWVTGEYLATDGYKFVLAFAALTLPVLLPVGAELSRGARSQLRPIVRGESARWLLWSALIAAITSAVLDLVGLWPWVWRWMPSFVDFTGQLYEQGSWSTFAGLLVVFGLLIPFAEEVVFRFGLLQALRRWSGSDAVAIVGSSAVFAVVHFGPSFRFSASGLLHAIWLFLFAFIAGMITLRRAGRIGVAVSLHAGRNLAEQIVLMGFIAASAR